MEINTGLELAEFPDEVKHVLDTPEMQRMDKVRQNGLVFLVYRATGSKRFAHQLGTANMCQRMFDSASRNTELDSSVRLLLTLEGLVHDVGQPAFSHSYEHEWEKLTGRSHEEVTADLINGNYSRLRFYHDIPEGILDPRERVNRIKAYSQVKSLNEALREIISNPGVVAEAIAPVTERTLDPFMTEFVDGKVVDADKLDYLVRDPINSGITECRVDADILLKQFRILPYNGKLHLAFNDKMLHMLTELQTARSIMYTRVYTHKTVLKAEAMALEAFRRNIEPFIDMVKGSYFGLLTDDEFDGFMNRTEDNIAAELYGAMETRRFYSIAWRIRSDSLPLWADHRESEVRELYKKIVALDSIAPEEKVKQEVLARVNISGPKLQPHEVLVYLKRQQCQNNNNSVGKFELYLFNEHDEIYDARDRLRNGPYFCELDRLFRTFSSHQTSNYVLVLCPREHFDRVKKATEEYMSELLKQ